MKVVAVIAEYNPFHNGHRYHVDAIRRDFGHDTAVVAIMSGSFTQRGEVAITDKWTRAACAVQGGVDLVLELPFPYAMSAAEFFACGGVHIAQALGITDALSFGSECGDLSLLRDIAERTDTSIYKKALGDLMKRSPTLGHARASEEAYHALYGKDAPFLHSPNDTLAVEYLRALAKSGNRIEAHTVRREGACYHETALHADAYPSATALRLAMKEQQIPKEAYPEPVASVLHEALLDGRAPTDGERLFPAVLSSFMLNKPLASDDIHDARGGLYHRLLRFAGEATSLSTWIALSETKKFTRARIRRALWYSFFGVTSSDMRTPPAYTQLLGASPLGLSLLKRIRKTTDIPILTKPSDGASLPPEAQRTKNLTDAADKLFLLTMPVPRPPAAALRCRPFFQKIADFAVNS